MPINEKGEYVREGAAADPGQNPEHEKLVNEANELTARQDQEPENTEKINAERKAAMRKRLLGQ